MTSAQIMIIVIIILYMAGMLAIGAIFNRKGATSTSDGFYIGGRSLGPIVTAMSAEASDMSSYLLMGLPGLAYIAGLAEVTWTVIGLSIGTYLNFLLVARLLRRYSEKIGASWWETYAIVLPKLFRAFLDGEKMIVHCDFGANRSRTLIEAFYYMLTGEEFLDEHKGEINHLAYNCKQHHFPPLEETERMIKELI